MASDRNGDEPSWWYRDTTSYRARTITAVLTPLSVVYGAVAARRMQQAPKYVSRLPVLCVGNFTAGGTGKTPLVREIVARLKVRGAVPVVLSRGYGGATKGPHRVDLEYDTAASVGDEPCLIARDCAVVVSADRAAGAKFIETAAGLDADVIVMDDGLQNPDLAKTLSIAVLDSRRAIGNGRTLPAGPLRAPLWAQFPRVSILATVTPPDAGAVRPPASQVEPFSGPRVAFSVAPVGDISWLTGARVLAFAGIGAPERFFGTLEAVGAELVERRAFPDHYTFEDADADRLIRDAERLGATLVTTEKDHVRLAGASAVLGRLASESRVLPIRAVLDAASSAHLDAELAKLMPAKEK